MRLTAWSTPIPLVPSYHIAAFALFLFPCFSVSDNVAQPGMRHHVTNRTVRCLDFLSITLHLLMSFLRQ
jgi:hypothetical protein